ncbi:App1 family protein [Pseudolysinimonas sp.]|uniref:App1 family protein n=1 Tax=Pseudolysinimonas sp. TaxID=2680009 RepID=UPI003783FF83
MTGVGDGIHSLRERWARQAGRVPTIVPFVGYGGDGWIRVLGRVVLRKPEPATGDRFQSVRGWRSFTSVPVRDAEITVTAGMASGMVSADRGGVIDARVEVDLRPGWSSVQLSVAGGGTVELRVFVVDESATFGVVSDIDDTVMVTALPRPFLAAWNTFVLNEHARTPVAGMAVLYERLTTAHPESPVVYLSTGAWNVVPTLTRFLSRNLYPRGALLLTDWGPTKEHWFRSGPEHKRISLERLAAEFPGIRWLLIGDDGQHDVSIYGDFARRYPEHVRAIAIRQLTPGEAVLAGGRTSSPDEEDTADWVYAPDGAGLSSQLRDLGVL